ncbi:hypothetical protein [Actinomycetospora chibensis]|uniref:Uncharacterized protein n=1 Tax=Actinomycetospora chibensis TaxID=663606 RepID=A0ABV9RNR5_9PSEU|nr:hypothetical protein [Actinomycetospora chibensis]MDD7924303.1 hypothetical protein [Actinomycetospora chibensis]
MRTLDRRSRRSWRKPRATQRNHRDNSRSELVAALDEAMEPALLDWWSGALIIERAQEPEPPEIIRRMRLNGLIDPQDE